MIPPTARRPASIKRQTTRRPAPPLITNPRWPMTTIGRRGALGGALASLALRGPHAWADASPRSGEALPAGQLLVASDEMTDPRFANTVIVMVRHQDAGALGIVVNRLIEERSMASLLAAIGESGTDVEGTVRVFWGGPVETGAGFVLHTADYRRDETIPIDMALSMTSSRDILLDIAYNRGPLKSLVAFGYAGWGPGQLDAEIAVGGWYTAVADPQLVFDDDRDTLWDKAVARRTVPL
jgi:putative transcriptional regulator